MNANVIMRGIALETNCSITASGTVCGQLIDFISSLNASTEHKLLMERFVRAHPVAEWICHGYFTLDYLRTINPHWLQFPPHDPLLHYSLAASYIMIMCCGVVGNFMVIFLFLRDLLMMLKMPIFIYNSVHQGPALGDYVCRVYGFIGGLSGTCSMCTITAISLDRYCVIKHPLKSRFSAMRAKFCALFAWLYALLFASIPLADIGYGKYTPEGFLTSCSFDYLTRNSNAIIFIWLFFLAAFVLPLSLTVFFYTSILRIVVRSARQTRNGPKSGRDSARHMKLESKKRQEVCVTLVVLTVIALWVTAWTPYAVLALFGICGYRHHITPLASMLPALFCKTASCCDPFVYALTHPKFKSELQALLCGRERIRRRHTFNTFMTRTSRYTRTSHGDAKDEGLEDGLDGAAKDDGNAGKKCWWYKPSFTNRSNSITVLARSFNHRSDKRTSRKESRLPEEAIVEELVLQNILLNDDRDDEDDGDGDNEHV